MYWIMDNITYLCSMSIRVRFNLGRGCNFMKWKIENMDTGEIQYVDPEDTSLVLYTVRLDNRKEAAKDIHSGANKYPCAWMTAEQVTIISKYETYPFDVDSMIQIQYNPKVNPFWSNDGKDIDKSLHKTIVTKGNKVYI